LKQSIYILKLFADYSVADMFKKVLTANRGEIALRIIRACKELGVKTVAVYSEADKESLHVQFADESHLIGPGQPTQSYLNINKIIEVAKTSKAEAIHPGYGFLAQIPAFAEACESNGIEFIGPSNVVLKKMGNKLKAREMMARARISIIPGSMRTLKNEREIIKFAGKFGYPILIKAVYGGGGRGMRVVNNEGEVHQALELVQLEAEASFGNSEVYVEKKLANPRHIEFQILADKKGNVIHLGERECSVQRKYQKLMEETPSPMMTEKLRRAMGETAIRAAKAVNYTNAGTVEFLVNKTGNFYFLEMNTRLQVEHLITEMVTSIDIVKEQIRIAAGEKLAYKQDEITMRGHAINCRINSENPYKDFTPSPGTITSYRPPGGLGVRVDSALYSGYSIPIFYDSLIAKLAVWGTNRDEAVSRMKNALEEYQIEGIETTIPLHKKILDNKYFRRGEIDINFVQERIGSQLTEELEGEEIAALLAALAVSQNRRRKSLSIIPQRNTENVSAWKWARRRNSIHSRTFAGGS